MRIGFTGHRNTKTTTAELDMIASLWPGSEWINGDAIGFDEQVKLYALAHGIPFEGIRPDYKSYPSKVAPLKRDEVIVDKVEIVIACYDGRRYGGTYYTINYAQRQGKPVHFVTCIPALKPVMV